MRPCSQSEANNVSPGPGIRGPNRPNSPGPWPARPITPARRPSGPNSAICVPSRLADTNVPASVSWSQTISGGRIPGSSASVMRAMCSSSIRQSPAEQGPEVSVGGASAPHPASNTERRTIRTGERRGSLEISRPSAGTIAISNLVSPSENICARSRRHYAPPHLGPSHRPVHAHLRVGKHSLSDLPLRHVPDPDRLPRRLDHGLAEVALKQKYTTVDKM